jgi:maleylpyruvate isomerase
MLATVDMFRDRDLTESSSLADWSLGHLLTHIARNTEALCNLLHWASTGIGTPMYSSTEQRNDDIKRGAIRPATVITDDVLASAVNFEAASQQLSKQEWKRSVRSTPPLAAGRGQASWGRLGLWGRGVGGWG